MIRFSALAGQPLSVARFAIQRILDATRKPNMGIKVGDKIPEAEVFEEDHSQTVNIAKICEGKKVILFGVPGAFTPACSKTHLPGFIKRAEEFKNSGFAEIICMAVNDPFVMNAWGKEHKANGKVRMLADPLGTFTKAVDLQMSMPFLGEVRSKRYSMILEDGIVRELNVEPDGLGLTCSLAEKINVT